MTNIIIENASRNPNLVTAVAYAANFLLERIADLDTTDVSEDYYRDWCGHVEPAIARLRLQLMALELDQ